MTFTSRIRIFGALTAVLASLSVGAVVAHAMIVGPLVLGSTGSQVTELQTYLATDPSIYPEGLITGYFGPLTQAAVQRFQAAQGIVSSGTPSTTGYGRVGPLTAARINALEGTVSNVTWDTVPVLGAIHVSSTNKLATFNWTTNEITQGQVYWDTSPIVANEATGPHQQPYVSGTFALDASGMQTNHLVTIANLAPNTTYYYLVRVVDSAGNVTITWPPGSFHTANN